MYARYFKFQAGPDRRSEVEALADHVFGFMRSLQGFVSVHFIISADENEYGSFSLWESRDDAVAAGESVSSEIGARLLDIAPEPPGAVVYEVYKPG
jgi:heme-degrading monooxygenase HmoA